MYILWETHFMSPSCSPDLFFVDLRIRIGCIYGSIPIIDSNHAPDSAHNSSADCPPDSPPDSPKTAH